MKTHRTPEQILADKEARRERFTRLKKAFDVLTESQRNTLAGMVVYTCDGHQLSPTNTALLNFQNPEVSIVGGFQQWRAQNRHVKKGEKAISIWIPLNKNGDTENTGSSDEVSENDQVYFRLQSVFDISQTEETVMVNEYETEEASFV